MGQILTAPITTKQTGREYNEDYDVGFSSMQGWRVTMEDSHTVLLTIPDDPSASFFGVFDGHGGANIAHFASQNLHQIICQQDHYARGNIIEGIRRGYLALDEVMRKDVNLRGGLSGSTAVTILLKDRKVYCGNAGDSRAIAMVKGNVRALSQDHKPTNPEERMRIHSAGGFVDMNRVNGNLALSRALGDFNLKKNVAKTPEAQIVTANPDVTVFDLSADWHFILMACDGIWDVLTNEEVGTFVAQRLAWQCSPELICEQLIDRCLAPDYHMGGIGLDNMTVVLIVFRNHQPSPNKSVKEQPTTPVQQ